MNAHPLRPYRLPGSYVAGTIRTWRAAGCLILLLALLGATPARAASLLEAYEAAVANDPVLGAAQAQLAANEEAVPQTRSLLLPNVGMNGSTAWNERDILGSGLPTQEYNDHGWGAQLAQPIVDMESWFTHSSARASVQAAKYTYDATELQLIVRTVASYLDVLRADSLVESSRRAEAATQRQLEQVQQRFDVGLVAITDVLEAQAGYDNAVVVRVQAVGDHDIFFEVLRTLTGEPYNEILDISEELPIVDPDPRNVEEWVTVALASNPTVLAAESQLVAAERTVRARRSGHLPTIDGTITYRHSVTGGPQSFFGGKTDSTIYGLTATLPIYQGGFVSSRTREAQALADRSAEVLQDSRLTISRDTRNLYRRVQTDVVRVEARLKAIASSKSALEATETGYEVGTRNVVDVLLAQQNYFRSLYDYADSRYSYMLSLILLKERAGVLAREDVEELNRFADPNAPVARISSLQAFGTN
ncbi:MAG: TolC family outer membrane protein [Pseudomonadales bacterium]